VSRGMSAWPYDSLAQEAIARRLSADTGIDGYAAVAMVEDVRLRGADSPYAAEVGEAAAVVLRPLIDAFGRFAEKLAAHFQDVAAAFGQAFAPLAELGAKLAEAGD
jgi:hypothetical protein